MQPDRHPYMKDSDTGVRPREAAHPGEGDQKEPAHRHLALGHTFCASPPGWCDAGSQRPPPTPSPVGIPLDGAHVRLVALAGARGPGARVGP